MIGSISLGNLDMTITSMTLANAVLHMEAATTLRSVEDIPADDTAVIAIRGSDGKLLVSAVCPVPEILREAQPGMNVYYQQDISLATMTFKEEI